MKHDQEDGTLPLENPLSGREQRRLQGSRFQVKPAFSIKSVSRRTEDMRERVPSNSGDPVAITSRKYWSETCVQRRV